jgi:acyl-coenzyme A synthetase/AMP-(fatty) acid ligase
MPPQPPYDACPQFPETFNLVEYFLDHNLAAGRGDKTALWCGDERRSYAEVERGSRRVAAALRRAGVRPEERVLLVLPDGFEFAEAWFGVLRAGGVFAMVNPLLKQADYAYYLRYSKARVAIVHAEALASPPGRPRSPPRIHRASSRAPSPRGATTWPGGSSPRARPVIPRPACTRTPTSRTRRRPTP